MAAHQTLLAVMAVVAAPVEWLQAVCPLAVFPHSVDLAVFLPSVDSAVSLHLVVDMLPVAFLPSVDDTAVCFLAVVAAIPQEVASVASAAGSTVDDTRAEIPDSIRPTNTDSRSIGRCRSKPSLRSSSFANRNSPIRNSNC